MEGHGAYNRSSGVQAAGSMPAVDLLKVAGDTADLAPAPQPIVIADYGCSEGRNSLLPMGVAISSLRPRLGADRAISVVHTDLPGNDFSALFAAIESDPTTYLAQDRQVFPSAVGRSFYEQILPSDVVTLGWSSWAVQWLSRVPCPIPDHVQVAYSRDAEACAAFARQAAEDWRTFLFHRAREMREGARLVLLTMATDDSDDFGYQPLLDMMYATLCGMVQDGLISADDLKRMVIPTVGRSRGAFAAPFEHGRFEGLTLERIEIFHGEDRVWGEFESSRDAQRFGAKWAAFSRASLFPSLAAALDDPSKAPSFIPA
jgi:hypothetical protein